MCSACFFNFFLFPHRMHLVKHLGVFLIRVLRNSNRMRQSHMHMNSKLELTRIRKRNHLYIAERSTKDKKYSYNLCLIQSQDFRDYGKRGRRCHNRLWQAERRETPFQDNWLWSLHKDEFSKWIVLRRREWRRGLMTEAWCLLKSERLTRRLSAAYGAWLTFPNNKLVESSRCRESLISVWDQWYANNCVCDREGRMRLEEYQWTREAVQVVLLIGQSEDGRPANTLSWGSLWEKIVNQLRHN